jgi:hypothetical protein
VSADVRARAEDVRGRAVETAARVSESVRAAKDTAVAAADKVAAARDKVVAARDKVVAARDRLLGAREKAAAGKQAGQQQATDAPAKTRVGLAAVLDDEDPRDGAKHNRQARTPPVAGSDKADDPDYTVGSGDKYDDADDAADSKSRERSVHTRL